MGNIWESFIGVQGKSIESLVRRFLLRPVQHPSHGSSLVRPKPPRPSLNPRETPWVVLCGRRRWMRWWRDFDRGLNFGYWSGNPVKHPAWCPQQAKDAIIACSPQRVLRRIVAPNQLSIPPSNRLSRQLQGSRWSRYRSRRRTGEPVALSPVTRQIYHFTQLLMGLPSSTSVSRKTSSLLKGQSTT